MDEEENIPEDHPLLAAAFEGRINEVRQLLADGADPDVLTDKGAPLHMAIENAGLEMVRCLVDAGADVNLSGESGVSPLCHAVGVACDWASQRELNRLPVEAVEVICVLLARGAIASEKRSQRNEQTPADLARRYDRKGLATFLQVADYLQREVSAEQIAMLIPGIATEDVEAYFAFIAGGGPREKVLDQISGW